MSQIFRRSGLRVDLSLFRTGTGIDERLAVDGTGETAGESERAGDWTGIKPVAGADAGPGTGSVSLAAADVDGSAASGAGTGSGAVIVTGTGSNGGAGSAVVGSGGISGLIRTSSPTEFGGSDDDGLRLLERRS